MVYALIAAAFVIPNTLAIYVIAGEMLRAMREARHARSCEPVTVAETSRRN